MTATDELRAELTKRGVEWKDYGYENHTWWSGGENVGWHAENRPSVRGLYVKIEAVLTPEQAIAATLGAGTCRLISAPQYGEGCQECSACGEVLDGYLFDGGRCPNCGAKVMDE